MTDGRQVPLIAGRDAAPLSRFSIFHDLQLRFVNAELQSAWSRQYEFCFRIAINQVLDKGQN